MSTIQYHQQVDGSSCPYIVTDLNVNDVLQGRGSSSDRHEGNIRFRALIKQRATEYRNTSLIYDKDRIAREVILSVQAQNGRFLRKIDSIHEAQSLGIAQQQHIVQAYYIPVDDALIVEKVKQALRDCNLVERARSMSSQKQQQPRRAAAAAVPAQPPGRRTVVPLTHINYDDSHCSVQSDLEDENDHYEETTPASHHIAWATNPLTEQQVAVLPTPPLQDDKSHNNDTTTSRKLQQEQENRVLVSQVLERYRALRNSADGVRRNNGKSEHQGSREQEDAAAVSMLGLANSSSQNNAAIQQYPPPVRFLSHVSSNIPTATDASGMITPMSFLEDHAQSTTTTRISLSNDTSRPRGALEQPPPSSSLLIHPSSSSSMSSSRYPHDLSSQNSNHMVWRQILCKYLIALRHPTGPIFTGRDLQFILDIKQRAEQDQDLSILSLVVEVLECVLEIASLTAFSSSPRHELQPREVQLLRVLCHVMSTTYGTRPSSSTTTVAMKPPPRIPQAPPLPPPPPPPPSPSTH